MFTYSSADNEKTVTIVSDVAVTADSELAIFLARGLQAIHAIVPLTSFTFARQANTDPPQYDYELSPQNHPAWPKWKQTLTFLPGNRVRQTFNVPTPGWELPEFSLQRPLRDLLIRHVFSHGIASVAVTWF